MSKQQLPLEELYPLMAQMLEKQGYVTFTVAGYSMQPMIYDRRDTVTLVKAKLPLKKYDLPFYRMDDGRFILHRVIRIHPDGTYECRGDNRWESENNIRDDQIIGVVKSFTRNGKKTEVDKSFGYYFYTRLWRFLHPFKKMYNLPKRTKEKIEFVKLRAIDKRRNRQKVKLTTEAGVMKKIEYRMATAADMKHIYKLSQKLSEFEVENFTTVANTEWAVSEHGQRYYQNMRKQHFLWVAACDGKPIAYCSGRIYNKLWYTSPVAELVNIYIDDEYRGMGIGNRMIDIFKDYCNTRGCKKIKVTFMDGNEPAEGIYSKHGFKPYEKIYLCDIEK